MTRRRTVAGGGIAVEVPPDRLVGWVGRFADRGGGLQAIFADPDRVIVGASNGTVATLQVPFAPMRLVSGEPVEALLEHLQRLGALGVILVRGGAHSVGVVRDGVVISSSTDVAYLQGRSAAGGWSQQRFARRRAHQRAASLDDAAVTAARVLVPLAGSLDGLVLGGDRRALADVVGSGVLAALGWLPARTFPDIAEPRRVVLEDIAIRSLSVEIVVETPQ